jgi:hypothetical protein
MEGKLRLIIVLSQSTCQGAVHKSADPFFRLFDPHPPSDDRFNIDLMQRYAYGG